jgi:ribosomal-protein-alanine N-acetyltransferase
MSFKGGKTTMGTIIETNRMRLRELNMDDIDNLLQIFSDPLAMKYYPSTKNWEETREWINWNLRNYKEYGIGLWAAQSKNSGQFIGQVGIVPQKIEEETEYEIGYLFVRKYWGKGLATEGAMACIEYGFHMLGRERLISLIAPSNEPSIRVAERIGMSLEKQIIRRGKETLVYSISNKSGY